MRSERERVTSFWLRLAQATIVLSLVLIFVAALVGRGMEKRVLALLSAPAAGYWQIDLLEVNRGLQHALTHDNNRFGFMWSPDGQEIGFSSSATGLTVMDWAGRNRRLMADSDAWMSQFAEGLSNLDTEWNAEKTERVLRITDEIYICDNDCAHSQRITNDGSYYDASPSWSPDDQQIVFMSDRGGSYIEIFVMGRDGTGIRQLTHSQMHKWTPDWSADGRQIAFVGMLGTKGEVFVMDADGRHIRRVTYNQMNDANPAWQP